MKDKFASFDSLMVLYGAIFLGRHVLRLQEHAADRSLCFLVITTPHIAICHFPGDLRSGGAVRAPVGPDRLAGATAHGQAANPPLGSSHIPLARLSLAR